MPAVVEADDDGLYVLKFRGAGQGPKALVAELVAGEIARLLGLPVPEIVCIELDEALARTEPDAEIQALIRASVGINVGLDYLPGSFGFDPLVNPPDADLASAIVWFDALVSNVDRTARNPNLLVWHRQLYLIDHGAALYFHHDWAQAAAAARKPFVQIRDHVLLPYARRIAAADARLAPLLRTERLEAIVQAVPDVWLCDPHFATPAAHRQAYLDHLCERRDGRSAVIDEALRAHAARV